jgi:hypothetical protein
MGLRDTARTFPSACSTGFLVPGRDIDLLQSREKPFVPMCREPGLPGESLHLFSPCQERARRFWGDHPSISSVVYHMLHFLKCVLYLAIFLPILTRNTASIPGGQMFSSVLPGQSAAAISL